MGGWKGDNKAMRTRMEKPHRTFFRICPVRDNSSFERDFVFQLQNIKRFY